LKWNRRPSLAVEIVSAIPTQIPTSPQRPHNPLPKPPLQPRRNVPILLPICLPQLQRHHLRQTSPHRLRHLYPYGAIHYLRFSFSDKIPLAPITSWSCLRRRVPGLGPSSTLQTCRGTTHPPPLQALRTLLTDTRPTTAQGRYRKKERRDTCRFSSRHLVQAAIPVIGILPVFLKVGHRGRLWLSIEDKGVVKPTCVNEVQSIFLRYLGTYEATKVFFTRPGTGC